MMLMFWIFALTDLFVAGIFYAVYGGKRKYAEGMLLGVHIPQSAADSEEVKVFMERYRKNTKRFYLWNGLAGIVVARGVLRRRHLPVVQDTQKAL